MPSEAVKVMVRVRPFNERERNKGSKNCVEADTQNSQITLLNPTDVDLQKVFGYDAVFPMSVTQQAVYEEAGFALVESVIDGYNGTIFAYGQTGCGKTHTMMGNPAVEVLQGIIPRAFGHIFGKINTSSKKSYLIRCSYIEIYNEEIHDLIGKDWKTKLELKESPDRGVSIKDVAMHVVKSVGEIQKLMDMGTNNRSVGETAMNKDSSRSHSIFTIYIEASENDEKGQQHITAGKLNLVDLAGSERQSKTGATGDRLKEANKINLSLSALGNVISALVDGKSSHIPYRDSKLTRLLQDSLGGNTKTVMVANVSPANDSYDETLGTLRYASRAKNIKNQPKVNEDPKDALLREYADEIKRLKEMMGNGNGAAAGNGDANRKERSPALKDVTPKRHNSNKLAEYENELKARDQQINDERIKREKLEALLKEMEQKTLQAGSQEGEEKRKYVEMAEKVKKMDKTQSKEALPPQKEEELLLMEKKYGSLQEEVDEQRKLIRKLRKKYKNAVQDVKDLEREHEINKEDLLDTVRLLEKDVKVNNAIMSYMLSPEELNKVRSKARWRDDRNEFTIPPFIITNKKVKFPKLPQHQAIAMVKEEWQNRDLEFTEQEPDYRSGGYEYDDNDDDEYNTYDDDFEDDNISPDMPIHRPPSSRKEYRVKNHGLSSAKSSNKGGGLPLGDKFSNNYSAPHSNGSVSNSRNLNKLNNLANGSNSSNNRYNSSDYYDSLGTTSSGFHERMGSQLINDRAYINMNSNSNKPPVQQKNIKRNVHLEPLNQGPSPGSPSPNLIEIKKANFNNNNGGSTGSIPSLTRKGGQLKPLAPIKEMNDMRLM